MKKFMLMTMLVVTLIVHCQYVVGGQVYCDYQLNGDEYEGVYWEDMVDNFTNACAADIGADSSN